MSAPAPGDNGSNPEDEWDGGLVTTFVFSFLVFAILMPIWLYWRRKFPRVYYPRKLDDPAQDTFTRWIIPTILLRGNSLLKHSGINGALYLQWKELSLVFLVVFSLIGVLVVMPIYYSQAPASFTFFDSLTAEAIPADSNLTWCTFIFSVTIAIGFLILLFFHRKGTYTRVTHINSSNKPAGYAKAKTCHKQLGGGYLLVAELSDIPTSVTDEEEIKQLISKKSNEEVVKVSIIWNGDSVEKHQRKRLRNQQLLLGHKRKFEETGERPQFRPSPIKQVPAVLLCHCSKVDAIDYYEKKVHSAEKKLIPARQHALESKIHRGKAFVVFRSNEACEKIVEKWEEICGPNYTELGANKWKFKAAKPLEEIYWKNYNTPTHRRRLIQVSGTIFVFILAMFWSIPVALLSNLENLDGIFGNAVNSLFQYTPVIYSLLQNLAPVLLQLALFTFAPYLCLYISKPEKHTSRSDLYASAMVKYWIFIIFNFYIFYLLFSSGIDLATALFLNPGEIREAFEGLNWSLYGAFYCNYLITLALYDAVFTFLRVKWLVKKYLYRYVLRHGTKQEKDAVFAPRNFKYFVSFAKETVYFATIMTFAPIVPMVIVCGILAYSMNYLADKNSVVLCSSFDPSAGKKMIFIFALFIDASMILTFLFWIFFFSSEGPSSIMFAAVPVFVLLWIMSIALLVSTRLFERVFFKNYSGLSVENALVDSKFSVDEVATAFSWEYITDPARKCDDPLIQELLD